MQAAAKVMRMRVNCKVARGFPPRIGSFSPLLTQVVGAGQSQQVVGDLSIRKVNETWTIANRSSSPL